ncbi:hypothetical protein SPURM210S_07365 [Streptomyces purpurascens]
MDSVARSELVSSEPESGEREPGGPGSAAAGRPAPGPGGEWVHVSELRPLLAAMNSLCDGDFTVRMGNVPEGIVGELAGAFDQITTRNAHLASELERVRREVVRQGRLDERLAASPGSGGWTTGVDAANALLEALAVPIVHATRVLDAVADGDLTQRAELHDGRRQLRGDLRRLGRGVNRMVEQLSLFTGELTRVSRGGRYRGPSRRACHGAGTGRRLALRDRGRQHDGVPADRAGARHRRGDHGGRAR